MAWTAPMTFVPNSVLTASQLNTYLRDNMMETMPAKATTAGRYFVTESRNTIKEQTVVSDFVSTADSTSSASDWIDLGLVGPSVTVYCQSKALVTLYAQMDTDVTVVGIWMSYEVSGATESSPTNNRAIMVQNTSPQSVGATILHQGLTPGLNTFSCRYRVTGGTVLGNWSNRRIAVMPF